MIDFDDINRRQQDGLKIIDTLAGDELIVLQHYCSIATEQLVKIGLERDAALNDMIINAYKYGIGLGLRLKVENGQVSGR